MAAEEDLLDDDYEGSEGSEGSEDGHGTIIVDSGSGLMKAGFAGDELPRCVFPTIVGRHRKNTVKLSSQEHFVGDEALCYKTSISYPIQRGVVQDWDDMENIWRHTFDNELQIDAEEFSFVLAEPPLNPTANREKMCELMFEHFHVPSLYIASQSVLALYAAAGTTGFVVDCGEGVTHFTPIYDGVVEKHAVKRLDMGGIDITNELQRLVNERGYEMNTTLHKELVKDLKEHKAFVSLDFENDIERHDLQQSFLLPDGTEIKIGAERCLCTEPLFQPNRLDIDRDGIHMLTHKSIMGVEIDIRKDLRENIIVTGGTTMLPGFGERLKKEMRQLCPPLTQININTGQDEKERQYSVWIGGSIIAMLDNFQDRYLEKEQYNEYGNRIIHEKFNLGT